MTGPEDTDIFDSLSELLQKHVDRLSEKLDGSSTIDKIEAELRAIDTVVTTLKRRDEWLEQLLDVQTSEERRQEILAMLKAQQMLVTGNKQELERLHTKSGELLARSVQLFAESQRRVDRLKSNVTNTRPS